MNRVPIPPWSRLLQRKTDEHFRRFHSDARNFTRRGFLSTAAAAAGLAVKSEFALAPSTMAAHKTAEPKPIPGGATVFGILVHHNPLPSDRYPSTSSMIRRKSAISTVSSLTRRSVAWAPAPDYSRPSRFAPTWEQCRANISARTEGTTMALSCSYDSTFTPPIR